MKCPYCGSENHTVNGNHKQVPRSWVTNGYVEEVKEDEKV